MFFKYNFLIFVIIIFNNFDAFSHHKTKFFDSNHVNAKIIGNLADAKKINHFLNINYSSYLMLEEFHWEKRVLINIVNELDNNFSKKVKFFVKNKNCEFKERNLFFIQFVLNSNEHLELPDNFQNKTGLWLIGYDGNVKEFSEDLSLLKNLFDVIDEMPIRKSEMKEITSIC